MRLCPCVIFSRARTAQPLLFLPRIGTEREKFKCVFISFLRVNENNNDAWHTMSHASPFSTRDLRRVHSLQQHTIKSQNISFICRFTSPSGEQEDSLHYCPLACERDGPAYSFHLRGLCHRSLPRLSLEMNYIARLHKQSVDMCCCLATTGGESSRISVLVRACLHTCD